MPEQLEPGILYHSPDYKIASHLCACGCGREVVNGLRPDRWALSVSRGLPSLVPSIGNGSFDRKSHYFITSGLVQWGSPYTDELIALARERDNPRARRAQKSFWQRAHLFIQNLFGSK